MGTHPTSVDDVFKNELYAIFNNAAVVLILVNGKGKIVKINETGCRMVGQKSEEIIGRLAGDVLNCTHAHQNEKVVCGETSACKACFLRNAFTCTFLTGESHYKKEGVFTIVRGEETTEAILQVSSAQIDIDGSPYILLTIDDITQERQQEKELKQLMESRDKLYAVIAHDLRGDIGIIKGFSDLLVFEEGELDENMRSSYIDMISLSANNIHLLLDNLFEWTSSKWYNSRINCEETDVRLLIDEVVEIAQTPAINKEITLYNLLQTPETAVLDKNMVKTVIRNLISNAIKFTERKGQISVNMKRENNDLLFQVRDNGIGMPKEKSAALFADKNRTDSAGTEREKGSGLGLIICKEFVEKHGGKIWAESEPGEGSTFSFTIPQPK